MRIFCTVQFVYHSFSFALTAYPVQGCGGAGAYPLDETHMVDVESLWNSTQIVT